MLFDKQCAMRKTKSVDRRGDRYTKRSFLGENGNKKLYV